MKSVQNILLDTSTFLLAGGRGSRLSPLTRRRSKPAVPFGDRCIIDFTLNNCMRSNLFGPHVITQYQAAHLIRHVRRWWLEQAASGAAVSSSPVCVPAPKPAYSATADALFRNIHLLNPRDQHVLVLSADHIYDMDYRELLQDHVSRGIRCARRIRRLRTGDLRNTGEQLDNERLLMYLTMVPKHSL